jgi:hypothetical protein
MAQTEPFVIDIAAAFDAYVKTQEKVWKQSRDLTVGASEAFDCLRKIGLRKRGKEQGYAVDDGYVMPWGATHRGNLIENGLAAPALAMIPKPIEVHHVTQSEQITFIHGKNSATPDGIMTSVPAGPVVFQYRDKKVSIDEHSGCIGIEIKSIDPRTDIREEKAKHHVQTQVGMGVANAVTEFNPSHWIIIYINASFLDDITIFVIESDPKIYKAAQNRANLIYSCEDVLKLPPEGKFDGGCDYCEFTQVCGVAEYSKWAAAAT